MAIAPYDPSAGGPSQGAAMDQMAAVDKMQSAQNQTDYSQGLYQSDKQFNQVTFPQLQSSMGATGQFYSTARNTAEQSADRQHQFQDASLASTFNRAQIDLKRQEVFAAMGLIL
jgi:hypothetical protein